MRAVSQWDCRGACGAQARGNFQCALAAWRRTSGHRGCPRRVFFAGVRALPRPLAKTAAPQAAHYGARRDRLAGAGYAAAGAELRFATDIDDYAGWTLARFLASPTFAGLQPKPTIGAGPGPNGVRRAMKPRRVLRAAGPFTSLSCVYEKRADSPIEENHVSRVARSKRSLCPKALIAAQLLKGAAASAAAHESACGSIRRPVRRTAVRSARPVYLRAFQDAGARSRPCALCRPRLVRRRRCCRRSITKSGGKSATATTTRCSPTGRASFQ